jgi:hypothetical protein
MNKKISKISTVFLGLLSFSQNSFSNESFLDGWKGYLHIEQAETKYTQNERRNPIDNSNPGQPFTRGQLSLNKNFQNGNYLAQYDVSYEAYQMEKRDSDATGHIFSNKFNIQRNSDILNLGTFVNYSENSDRGENNGVSTSFWHFGVQANKFFDNTKTRAGISYGKVRGDDQEDDGIAVRDLGNNYNIYLQQYFNENLRLGYSFNLLNGGRDDRNGTGGFGDNNRVEVDSHLLNMEYYLSPKYPIALTASYELINYKPSLNEPDRPLAKEFKLGIKYVFGGEKSLMAFDKGRISHQANAENYWTHFANEID